MLTWLLFQVEVDESDRRVEEEVDEEHFIAHVPVPSQVEVLIALNVRLFCDS